jgi:hypothetical protein
MTKFETYISVDGVMTKQTSVDVVVDVDAEIASKEEELLKVYAEIEALKAEK